MDNVQAIRTQLASCYTTRHSGKALRQQLAESAQESYVPKHAPQEYLEFLSRNAGNFRKIGGCEVNFPYVWKFFSAVSQHVYGDCIEECLDQAIEMETQSLQQLGQIYPVVKVGIPYRF